MTTMVLVLMHLIHRRQQDQSVSNRIGESMKRYIAILVSLIALAFASTAGAATNHHSTYTLPVITTQLCVDKGSPTEHTVTFHGTAPQLIAFFLARRPGSVGLGACVVTEPPVVEPPVVVPPVVIPPVLPPAPDTPHLYLCYSHYAGSIPMWLENWDLNRLLHIPGTTYFEPIAVAGNVNGGINVGNYHLICDTTGLKTTGTGVNGSEGDYFDATAWKDAIAHYGNTDGNHFALYIKG